MDTTGFFKQLDWTVKALGPREVLGYVVLPLKGSSRNMQYIHKFTEKDGVGFGVTRRHRTAHPCILFVIAVCFKASEGH